MTFWDFADGHPAAGALVLFLGFVVAMAFIGMLRGMSR